MNREIKFRAYNIDRKLWDYFVIDDLDKEQGRKRGIETVGIGSFAYFEYVKEGLRWWGQYTGLKDKNGKEVWEGDVLSRHHEKVPKLDFDEIKNLTDATFYVHPSLVNGREAYDERHEVKIPDIYCWYEDTEDYEVAGNVYENPDLLEDNK